MFHPMLAEPHPATPDAVRQLNGTYVFERKYDGIRGILAWNGGTVTLTNRNGVNISHRYPEVIREAELFAKSNPDTKLILDGELLCENEDRTDYDFAAVHRRDAQSDPRRIAHLAKVEPALFMAFDVLYDEVDLRNLPLSSRREQLLDVEQRLHNAVVDIHTVVGDAGITFDDGEQALQTALQHKWEGIVAKRLNSPYGSGRSSAWKKIKPTKTGSFIVLGLEPGNGSRADTFGALHIGVKTPDGFQAIGKVGSGFRDSDLRNIKELWESVELGLTPPPVIEVEYQEITASGALRFPVFKTVRTDVVVDDCTRERQLV